MTVHFVTLLVTRNKVQALYMVSQEERIKSSSNLISNTKKTIFSFLLSSKSEVCNKVSCLQII